MKLTFLFFLIIPILAETTTTNTSEPKATAVYHSVASFEDRDGNTILPLNTAVSIIMYDENILNQTKDEIDNIIYTYHKEADSNHYYTAVNNIAVINDSYGTGEEIKVSDFLYDLIEEGIKLTKTTKGAFNIAMGSLIDVYDGWFDFANIPVENDINPTRVEEALTSIPSYEDIDKIIELNKENKTIKLNKLEGAKVNTKISLGAISKGYIMQYVYDYVKTYNTPCILSAGSSTLACVNTKLDGSTWNINLTVPNVFDYGAYLFPSDYLCQLRFTDSMFISTSAVNQQNYLKKNGEDDYTIRHHILDATTGYANNYYRSITFLSTNASLWLLDSLTTACFNIEKEEDILSLLENIKNEYQLDNLYYMFLRPYSENKDEYILDYDTSIKDMIYNNQFSSSIKEVNSVAYNNNPNNPKTEDNNDIVLYLIVGFFILAIIGGTIYLKKKNNKINTKEQ